MSANKEDLQLQIATKTKKKTKNDNNNNGKLVHEPFNFDFGCEKQKTPATNFRAMQSATCRWALQQMQQQIEIKNI